MMKNNKLKDKLKKLEDKMKRSSQIKKIKELKKEKN